MVVHACRALILGGALLTGWMSAASAQTGTISGRITESGTGQPVAGAVVQAFTPTGGLAAGRYSDDQGEYRLGGLRPGLYRISVRRQSYEQQEIDSVRVEAGGTAEVSVTLSSVALELERQVVTAGRREQRQEDAPAHTEVVTSREVEESPSLTPIQQIRAVPGVDFAQSGLQSGNVVVRGFNNVFSGALLTISDYRYATVPSLRVNTGFLVPTTNEDIDQIEVVLGPGAALYGPNSTNGVMHILSRSPFESQGTTLSVGAGERSVFRGAIRHAGTTGPKFGYKLSAQILRGEDWRYVDPAEEDARSAAIAAGARADTLRIGRRDFDIERYTGEARLDFRLTENTLFIASAGTAVAGTALEMTGIGTAQAKDWRYDYYQGRFSYKRLFAQAFLNQSNTEDTYLLRTGQGVLDKSRVLVGQIQHGIDLGTRQSFIYGVDYQHTDPRTERTINGRYEDIDEIREVGGYIQSESRLSPKLDFVVAARVDDHSELEDLVFSPRAALVFKPAQGQNFRLTYNRAFGTPTTNNLFLDLVAGRIPAGAQTLHEIRTIGVPSNGFSFGRDCTGGLGSLCMRTAPLLVALGGGGDPSALVAAEATRTWRGVVELLIVGGAPPTLRGIPAPTSATVQSVLAVLDLSGPPGTFRPLSPGAVRDIPRLRPNISNTYELGYNGLVADRLRLAADVYYEKRTDFVGPLVVETPNIFYDTVSTRAYLQNFMPQANARALAVAIGRIPVGTVSPRATNPLTNDSDLILTYRNYGDVNRWGADIAGEGIVTDRISINASYSFVNRNFFPQGGVADLTLNAPRNKASLGARYREVPTGVTVDVRGRWVESFPMNSGAFIGRVDSYTLADVILAYRFPFAQNTILSINAQNIFDDKHQEFIGAPALGRFVLSQLQVTF